MINWKILVEKAIGKSAVLVIYPTNWDSRDAQQLTWNVRALLLFLGHKTIFVMSFTVMAMVLARQIWLTFMLFLSDKLHRLNILLSFLRRIHTAMKCSFCCPKWQNFTAGYNFDLSVQQFLSVSATPKTAKLQFLMVATICFIDFWTRANPAKLECIFLKKCAVVKLCLGILLASLQDVV